MTWPGRGDPRRAAILALEVHLVPLVLLPAFQAYVLELAFLTELTVGRQVEEFAGLQLRSLLELDCRVPHLLRRHDTLCLVGLGEWRWWWSSPRASVGIFLRAFSAAFCLRRARFPWPGGEGVPGFASLLGGGVLDRSALTRADAAADCGVELIASSLASRHRYLCSVSTCVSASMYSL